MFTKMVLPQLGGAAAVWSVAMVFFQTALLAGYAYAHLLTRFAPGRASVIIHLAVMVVACFALPLHIATGWGRPPPDGEAFWLLGLFAVSIGCRSSRSPPMGRCCRPGSCAPIIRPRRTRIFSMRRAMSEASSRSSPIRSSVEPFVRLGDQTLVLDRRLLCPDRADRGLRRAVAALAQPGAGSRNRGRRGGRADLARRRVLGRAGGGALGLLIAVTAHISTDVAAVPLLWVVPLALYLLTFVIVFQTRPIIPHRLVVDVQPFFILALVFVFIMGPISSIVGLIALHLAVFFVCALMCHGELAAAPARAAPPHRLLHVDVGRRHDRRHRGRAHRAARVQLGRRISDPDRARGAVPARACAAGARHRAISAVRRAWHSGAALVRRRQGVRHRASTTTCSTCSSACCWG